MVANSSAGNGGRRGAPSAVSGTLHGCTDGISVLPVNNGSQVGEMRERDPLHLLSELQRDNRPSDGHRTAATFSR